MNKFIIAVLALAVLSGCSKNPDGSYTVGVRGSTAWFATAPVSEVKAFWSKTETYKLCLIWDKNYDNSFIRSQLAKELKRRGENPLKCSNPSADQNHRLRDQAKKSCKAAWRSWESCRMAAIYAPAGSYSPHCYKPSC
jgi:hypothetical protein